jgi:predicted peptidase
MGVILLSPIAMWPLKWFILTLLVLLPCMALAKKHETGFLDRTVSISGVAYRYQVYVPADWDKSKKWPVILFLHGSGERGSDGLLQTDVGLPHAIRKHSDRVPFIVVMPQCRMGRIWTDPDMEAQAFAALDNAAKEFHADADRTYLSGISMGGAGTWAFGAKYAGRFAALVPVCGRVHPRGHRPGSQDSLATDPSAGDPYAETARGIGKTPVWIFHGADDDTVPVEESRKMHAALEAAGGNVKYTEYPGVGHESWVKAYDEPALFPWLLEHHLKQ